MSISKRCPKCHTWNNDRDYCEQCNQLLNHETARKIEVEQQEQQHLNREKDSVDIFLHNMRHSRYIIIRAVFYLFYSVWFVFTAIVSLGVAIVAAGPG
ncbi:MAG: hypothetical protein NT150_05510 [Bacteroidetes bacterium]|nr:hypothetical protein [Bacteroidota bacterium]